LSIFRTGCKNRGISAFWQSGRAIVLLEFASKIIDNRLKILPIKGGNTLNSQPSAAAHRVL